MDDLLTTVEAAALLGLDPSMVSRYCRAGRLPAKRVGHYHLIRREDVLAFRDRPAPGRPKKAADKSG